MDSGWRKKTIETYDRGAKKLTEYFRGYSRKECIEMVFKLAGNPTNAKVLEIGCGDGRDAKEIIKRTSRYRGFDLSKELIKIAREYVPEADFEIADAVTYNYPTNQDIDIVFAFASLLHVDKIEMKYILNKLKSSLRTGAVLYLSLKYSPEYQEEIKVDQHGERLFYHYSQKLIEELAGDGFTTVFVEEDLEHGTSKNKWLEIAIVKS